MKVRVCCTWDKVTLTVHCEYTDYNNNLPIIKNTYLQKLTSCSEISIVVTPRNQVAQYYDLLGGGGGGDGAYIC